MTPFIRELKIQDPIAAFAALEHLPYSLIFDSADRKHSHARYSFIVSHPIETIESKDGEITLTNWEEQTTTQGNVFDIIAQRLKYWIPETQTVRGLPPFQGGAAGYFGYNLEKNPENINSKTKDKEKNNSNIPDLAIGIYDQVLAFDHEKNQTWLITHAKNYHEARRKQDYLLGLISNPPSIEHFEGEGLEWTSNFTKEAYKKQVQTIINYIEAGDVFQVNLARRLDATLPKDFSPFTHYCHLREKVPAPFASYMNCGSIKISSASPESFISIKDRMVETRPIKGTRPRSTDPQQDKEYRRALEASEKDHAENTMIVDLMRNDLSKTCLSNSVQVSALCALESFSNVHHLVSTIRGTLKKRNTPLDVLKHAFPGGSITGAPKIRAMEIIEELEPTHRGPYCGSMAYIGFDATMDSSILIRSLVYENDTVSLQAGGGIVSDSNPEDEYQETQDKADAILKSFQTTKKPKAVQQKPQAKDNPHILMAG